MRDSTAVVVGRSGMNDGVGQNRVLVVNDEPLIRDCLVEFLISRDFACETASTAHDAMRILRPRAFALVIAKMEMPHLNGLQLLKHLSHADPNIAIIIVDGTDDAETAVQAMKSGAYDYLIKPFNLAKLSTSVRRAMEFRQFRLENRKYLEKLKAFSRNRLSALNRDLRNLKEHDDTLLELLARALDAQGHEAHSHSRRIQAYTIRLAQQLGFSRRLTDLSRGALLHDIGVIGIPRAILLKPGNLDPAEQLKMKRHTIIGSHILQGIGFLDRVAKMVLHHHERYDGFGYPMGLKGEAIPPEARILSVMDAYDAMTSDRPYRKALSADFARSEINDKAGAQFDPQVVKEFLKVPQSDWDKINAKFSWMIESSECFSEIPAAQQRGQENPPRTYLSLASMVRSEL